MDNPPDNKRQPLESEADSAAEAEERLSWLEALRSWILRNILIQRNDTSLKDVLEEFAGKMAY